MLTSGGNKMKAVSVLGLAAALLSHSVANARRSLAMFDLGKDYTVEAVVKEVQFTNPHVWLQIMVTEAGRRDGVEHRVAPGMMLRNGWKPSTLKPGDKVTLAMHPLKNGSPGGSLVSVKVPDGRFSDPVRPTRNPDDDSLIHRQQEKRKKDDDPLEIREPS